MIGLFSKRKGRKDLKLLKANSIRVKECGRINNRPKKKAEKPRLLDFERTNVLRDRQDREGQSPLYRLIGLALEGLGDRAQGVGSILNTIRRSKRE